MKTNEQSNYKTYTKSIQQFNKYGNTKLLESCEIEVDDNIFLKIVNKTDIRFNYDEDRYEIIVLNKNKQYINNMEVRVS